MVAAWIRWTMLADLVIFVPSYQHAFGKHMLPFDRRMLMCKRLAEDLGPWARHSDIECGLRSPYTIDMLRALKKYVPQDAKLRLVVGADNVAARDKWYAWEEIEVEFSPIYVGRPGYPSVSDMIPGAPETPVFPDISSTEIRRRILAGEPIDHLVPACIMGILNDIPRDAWTL